MFASYEVDIGTLMAAITNMILLLAVVLMNLKMQGKLLNLRDENISMIHELREANHHLKDVIARANCPSEKK